MFSDEGQEDDEWANFQQTNDQQIVIYINNGVNYEYLINSVDFHIKIDEINEQKLKHHRIKYMKSTQINSILKSYHKDCYITIKKKHHYGTHCIYDVVIAHFVLQIHVLNLHRSSDQHDITLSQTSLGSGGFGSVRSVRIGEQSFAIKRINFKKKFVDVDGFDLQTQYAQCKQIQDAIRQYSLYKICSMLEVGPIVLFESNYDLVCFTNCIQFAMQLCVIPSKNPNFMQSIEYNKQILQTNLLQNMKLLHSLKIVHRDIKPQNILYSQSLKRFVFTDFGITHALQQNYYQKTFTSFAGTIEYCSQDMKSIMDIPNGYVNLYQNDYYSLQKTIATFSSQIFKSSSLSYNAMSFNSFNDHGHSYNQNVESSLNNSIQQWFQTQSQCSSDNIYFKSTHSLNAPQKYASEINYYQSMILYELLKGEQCYIEDLSSVKINEINNDYIFEEVKRYVILIFYPSESQLSLTLKIIDLKNMARNYGPKSEQAHQKLQQILLCKQVLHNEEVLQYFRQIRYKLQNDDKHCEIDKFQKQIRIHLYLKNYNYFISCSLSILRQTVKYKEYLSSHFMSEQFRQKYQCNLSFICELYILCNKLNVLTINETHKLNDMFIKLWQEDDIYSILQVIKNDGENHNYTVMYHYNQNPLSHRITNILIKYALDYLIKSNHIRLFYVIQAFSIFVSKFSLNRSQDYILYKQYMNIFEDKINQLQIEDSQQNCSIILQLIKIERKVLKSDINKTINIEQSLMKINDRINILKSLQNKKYYLCCQVQLLWIDFQTRRYQESIRACNLLQQIKRSNLIQTQKYNLFIQVYSIIGATKLSILQIQQSLSFLNLAKYYILQYYGIQNLSNSYYQCMNNIAYAYFRSQRIHEALKIYNHLRNFLQKQNKSLLVQKSLVLRSILSLRLEIGIKKQQYKQISILIKDIVYETIYTLLALTTSDNELKGYILDVSIFNFIYIPKDIRIKIYIMKTLIRYLQDHLHYFIIPYDKINYQLNKIYTQELKMPSKALPFIWNYIKVKLLDFHNITKSDFILMNNFINNLIKRNSSRRALIILKKYIFHIPLDLIQQRRIAFKIFHRLNNILGDRFEKISYQLMLNDCKLLQSRNFTKLYKKQKTKQDILMNLMLKKWIARL